LLEIILVRHICISLPSLWHDHNPAASKLVAESKAVVLAQHIVPAKRIRKPPRHRSRFSAQFVAISLLAVFIRITSVLDRRAESWHDRLELAFLRHAFAPCFNVSAMTALARGTKKRLCSIPFRFAKRAAKHAPIIGAQTPAA
jgi:hypothetical protein